MSDLTCYEVLWTSFRRGKNQIFRVDLESGDTVNLTRNADVTHRYPSWSPDGVHVAFTSDGDGTHNLYLLNLLSSQTRQLTHEKAPVVAGMQSWTPDSKWIYFGLFEKGQPLICRIHRENSHHEELFAGIDPAISPDGKRLVYARAHAAGHLLYVSDAEGNGEQQLTEIPNAFAGVHATWTPDGQAIIYADRVGNALELFGVAPDGSERRQITSLGKAATSPYVAPDGNWITFRVCEAVYWKDPRSSERAYREQVTDFRPVWRMRSDGSGAEPIELLRYGTTIDGSRVPIQSTQSSPSGVVTAL